MSLPDGHGLKTVEKAMEFLPATPIIVLTGQDDEQVGLSAIKTGAQDYLVKGKVSAEAMLRAIRYAVSRNEIQQALHESEERLVPRRWTPTQVGW